MEIKEAIKVLYNSKDSVVSEVYDTDQELATALKVVVPDFEYPDFSHKTVQQVLLPVLRKTASSFEPGSVHLAGELVHDYRENPQELMPFVHGHLDMKRGELTEDDWIENLMAVVFKEGRVFSKFELLNGKHIYIITTWEDEEERQPRLTTIMYPSDY